MITNSVNETNRVSTGEVDAEATAARAEDEAEDACVGVEAVHHALSLRHVRRPVQPQVHEPVVPNRGARQGVMAGNRNSAQAQNSYRAIARKQALATHVRNCSSTSSMRVICVKMSARWPPALRSRKIPSRTCSLPQSYLRGRQREGAALAEVTAGWGKHRTVTTVGLEGRKAWQTESE